ncbi:hypothetical protein BESB_053810 [Besnoitia besnoiti]|uniref:Uncharacterized protein n=1 Tax=Besnoitia besnoiti TaxID=94643 RepID=A0A2A9MJZ6_BESBE|nr:hypothetical protein BESB_053810 [Besnoitia besnoiti]PFH35730.1 hypothetical protein BESB_053810 [Besnoitia besnoiti]
MQAGTGVRARLPAPALGPAGPPPYPRSGSVSLSSSSVVSSSRSSFLPSAQSALSHLFATSAAPSGPAASLSSFRGGEGWPPSGAAPHVMIQCQGRRILQTSGAAVPQSHVSAGSSEPGLSGQLALLRPLTLTASPFTPQFTVSPPTPPRSAATSHTVLPAASSSRGSPRRARPSASGPETVSSSLSSTLPVPASFPLSMSAFLSGSPRLPDSGRSAPPCAPAAAPVPAPVSSNGVAGAASEAGGARRSGDEPGGEVPSELGISELAASPGESSTFAEENLHPLRRAWVGWRCLCYADPPPGTTPLERFRVNEGISHIVGFGAETCVLSDSAEDTEGSEDDETRREFRPEDEQASNAAWDAGAQLRKRRRAGEAEREKKRRQKTSAMWAVRSGGERLARDLLLTRQTGGPFEKEILEFLGRQHVHRNHAFDQVLAELEAERLRYEESACLSSPAGLGTSGRSRARPSAGPDASNIAEVDQEAVAAALSSMPSMRQFAETVRLEALERDLESRLSACEARKAKLKTLCAKARKERECVHQEHEELTAKERRKLDREQSATQDSPFRPSS